MKKTNKKADDSIDWRAVFEEKILLKPNPTDLSYYHWRSGQVEYNNSDNYTVIHDPVYGLVFMYKGDRKLICVDPTQKALAENATRTMIYSEKYNYVTFYDHLVRKKI